MNLDLINVKDILEVPLLGSIIFYISMIKKKNLFENCILYLAITMLGINLYIVIQNMKNIKESKENNVIYEERFQNGLVDTNQFEYFENEKLEYFIPSNTFNGQKNNYIFTTRDEGTGYYLDN